MTETLTLDIPHKLGKAVARERLDRGIGKIGSLIPGAGHVRHDWEGDMMNFKITAIGQTMVCRATVFDENVDAVIELPPMLGMFAARLRGALSQELPKLLT